ncbi:MAG TPA: DNA-binding protein WhiA [Gaiellaceae bacterium]|nr:DNA-binding protein WhiA [Gaiellaceae bacterium]
MLSENVRGELAAIEPRKPCCRLAELSALIRGAGSIHFRGRGRIAVHLDVSSAAVARRVFTLLKGYGVAGEIHTFRRQAFERATRFRINIEDDARAVQTLNEMGVVDARLAPLERPPARVVSRACCRAAYLRGAFLAAGSVSGPRNAHLELRAASVEGAELVARLGREEGFALAVRDRGRHAVTYLKGREAIAELLAFMGAQEAALELGESAVVAATRARANRLANADHANIVRASRAADAQLRAIRRLEAAGRLEHLPADLREVADLRSRHPTLSLGELARRLRPPATKAAAHRRLAKLQKLAER